jgi:hypothetical protein
LWERPLLVSKFAIAKRISTMTKTAQICNASSIGYEKDLSLNTLEVEAHLGRVERLSGNEYVPMDVFVDPETRKEHFRYSPVRVRWFGIAEAAAR